MLCALQFLYVALPPLAGAAGPATPPTPAQLIVVQEAVRRGEFSPEARQVVRSNPELKQFLPPKWREELDAETGSVPIQEGVAGEAAARAIATKAERMEKPVAALFDWRKSVYVSKLFASRLSFEEAHQLSFFGHELFDPRAEIPVIGEALPVPDNYVVGPGDELVVKLWGRLEGTYRLRVDRDGKVFLPKMGPLSVAGKTLGEVKTLLRNRFGTTAEVNSDVSIGQMKGFIVSVLGEVQAPGRYQVSTFHTAFQSIAMAGGIKDIGSLRRVQVKRGTETPREIDIYDFLLRGDVTHDIRLTPGDAVFVPVVGPLVAVAGEVRRPAIYELKGERAIREVVETAGGLAPSAYKRRVQVERLEGNRARVAIDLNLEEAEPALSTFQLKDGDILRILAVLPEMENVVEVEGNVQRPGKYEWTPGLTVASLVPDEKFFLQDTFLDYALVTRLEGPDRLKVILPVNLRKIIVDRDAASDVALQPMDTLTVYNVSSFRERMVATVEGEVRNPGAYEILPGTRVSDLVKLGGDLTRNASLEEAEIARLTGDRKNTTILTIDLGRALSGDPAQDLLIRDQDQLMVRPMPDILEQRYITLAGEIRSPGVYAARKGERLSSILRRAGGFTQGAFLRGAIFTRVSVQRRQQELIDRTVEDLEQEVARTSMKETAASLDKEDVETQKQVLETRKLLLSRLRSVRSQGRVIVRLSEHDKLEGTENDLVIEPGDQLMVPRTPQVVNVMGRVYNPTAVVFNPANSTTGYYLQKVGGPTEDADRDHIFVVQADGSILTKTTADRGFWMMGDSGLMSSKLEAGDAIVVPEKLAFSKVMKDVKDITQIMMQLAVTLGVFLAIP
ncbi:MAG: periplasmic polysaccharide biosynthesis/export protein [Deltaproteobacteria bacterium]|nr:periplasmic polysaccharide biosynthesis/export protein [Deltaproteobacteria bacterium]